MGACNAGGEWQECLALLDERRALPAGQAQLDAHAYSVATAACAQGRQPERALALVAEMRGGAEGSAARSNPIAWNNAMVACTRGAQPREALALYDEMRAGACEISEHSVAAALVACRASADGGAADWQRAQSVFDGARARSTMVNNALFDALAAGKQWPLLLRYFEALRAAGQGGARPDRRSYERAIEACDQVDPERSLVLIAEMNVSGL